VTHRFAIGLGRNDAENYAFDVVVHKNHRQLQRWYRQRTPHGRAPKYTPIAAYAVQYHWSRRSEYIGLICFSSDNLTDEIIAHESTHAALYLASYIDHYFGLKARVRDELVARVTGLLYHEICGQLRKHKLTVRHALA
jgi:hypothetical protein